MQGTSAVLTASLTFVSLFASFCLAADPVPIKHPNLLLNRDEIDQIKVRATRQPWATKLMEKLKADADETIGKSNWGDQNERSRELAICYALTGETRYADAARRKLIQDARGSLARYEKLDVNVQPETCSWAPWGAYAWAYDLTYDTFTDEERQLIERWLRESCRIIMRGAKIRPTTPNLEFNRRFNVGLVGYCLGDPQLINWGLTAEGRRQPAPRRVLPDHGFHDQGRLLLGREPDLRAPL